MQFQIRLAKNSDLTAVYKMAKELAKMQNLLTRFCLTPDSLEQMINDPLSATSTIVVEYEGKIIGFAMHTLLKNNRLYHNGYAMYIDELYVEPDYRGHAIGTALFKYIAKVAVQNACNRLEWWVEKENHKAFDFYAKMGARALTEFITYRLQEPALSAFENANI